MIFLSYDFVIFALVFFFAYKLAQNPETRLLLIIAGGITFQAFYGGIASSHTCIAAHSSDVLRWAFGQSGPGHGGDRSLRGHSSFLQIHAFFGREFDHADHPGRGR